MNSRRTISRIGRRLVGGLAFVTALGVAGSAWAAGGAEGRGYGLDVTADVAIVGLSVPLADTGAQSAPPNFNETASVLNANVTAAPVLTLTTGVINGHTDATLLTNQANASGGVENLNLTAVGLLGVNLLGLTADTIQSEAHATCTNGEVAFTGKTTIANLVLNAASLSPLTVNGEPIPNYNLVNTSLLGLANLKVTLNQQSTVGGLFSVNALSLHLNVLGLAVIDITIGHSEVKLSDCDLPVVTLAKTLASGSPSVATPGGPLSYDITLTNSGGTAATGYAVTDQLDPNVTFVSASNGGTLNSGKVVWAGLTVPANGTLVLNVAVTVNNPLPAGTTSVSNVAFETGTTPPDCTVTPDAAACVMTPTPVAAVTLAKTLASGSPSIATPGGALSYAITLTNSGGIAVAGYAVTDQLDPNVTFVSADNGGTLSGSQVSWTNLTVPANSTRVLNVTVTVNDPLPAGTTGVSNVAFETGTTPPNCAATPGAAACVVTPTPVAAVTLAKTLASGSPSVATPGGPLSYAITLTNSGGIAVAGYAVTDQLDPNVTFVSADNGGTLSGSQVSWTGLAVPAHGTRVLNVAVSVNNPLPTGTTSVSNVAFETGTTPPNCAATPGAAACVTTPTYQGPPGSGRGAASIPTLSQWALLLLMGLMLAAGWRGISSNHRRL